MNHSENFYLISFFIATINYKLQNNDYNLSETEFRKLFELYMYDFSDSNDETSFVDDAEIMQDGSICFSEYDRETRSYNYYYRSADEFLTWYVEKVV